MTMPHFTARDRVPGAPVTHAAPTPPVKAWAAAPHSAPIPPAVQHDLHPHPPGAPAMPTAKITPPAPAANKPVHEETRSDRVPAQAMLDRAQANALRHGDVVRERTAPASPHERGSIDMHTPPVRHAEAAPPPAPALGREGGAPGQPAGHAVQQPMLAMHNEHPHPAQPAPPAAKQHEQHAEKHEEHKHPHDKQDSQ
jgi:hypothetical protein